MATKYSLLKLQEISSESDWDDSEEDPDYDVLEETRSNFSNLTLKNKGKSCVLDVKGLGSDTDPEVSEVTAPVLDEEKFEKVQNTIQGGLLEKLKVDECKMYLRKNGLRLTGNKDTLTQRIKEHLEILNGGGEKKYPPYSFVLSCKGDACTGDVVLFEQNVYEMYNIASRSASGPPCGKRTVAGRIVKESYGASKQQHTFTIEVLWSKGEKPLPPLYPLLIKGRNLYRLKTLRQKWEDEAKRQKMLMEKHSRGSVARANREARIQEKEKRKQIKENRDFKKDSVRNQCQSHSGITMSQYQPKETNVVSINPEKPEFPSQNSGLSANIRKETSAIVKGPAYTRNTCDIDHMKGAELGANYHNYADLYSRAKPTIIEKYHPFIAETTGFGGMTHHRVPLANANHFPSLVSNRESYKQNQLCRHYTRGRCYFGDNCRFLHDLKDKRSA